MLSDAFVRTVKPPEKGQAEYRDSLPGFTLRVSQGGTKTFSLTVDRQRQTIGRYPIITLSQARERAKTILAEKQLGLTPKPSPTLDAVIDEYLHARNVRASTRQADGYILKRFRDGKPIATVTAKDIERGIASIEAPSARHNAYTRLSALFRYAKRRGYVQNIVCEALEAPRRPESRERVLSPAELAKVAQMAAQWRADGHQYGDIVLLCLYTGQRRQQIASLTEEMVDFNENIITWPPELMKTNRRHAIPFGPSTKAILQNRHTVDGSYFPGRNGGTFSNWADAAKAFREDCQLAPFVLHDLRRSMATVWQSLGIPIETTEKYLSHRAVTGGLIGVYQRYDYLREMREAVALWEQKLQALTA